MRPQWPARPALFLDLDGTLLEFAREPSGVAPTARLLELLGRLSVAMGGAMAVISGRPIHEIDRLLRPHTLPAAGVHGLQRRSSRGSESTPSRLDGQLEAVRPRLDAFVERNPGTLVEDKCFSLALHYRQRPDIEPAVDVLVAVLRVDLPAELELLRGDKVVEIKPAGFDKGAAIGAFMQESPFEGRTPVFIGDDVTDETGFCAVNEMGGLSIKVGAGRTAAKSRLTDVEAVLCWLEELLARQSKACTEEI